MEHFLPKTAKDIKGKVALAELRRAHYIIVGLALSFAAMLWFATINEVQFDALLGAIAIVLLLLVAAVSARTIYALNKTR